MLDVLVLLIASYFLFIISKVTTGNFEVIFRSPAVAGRVLWQRVCPSSLSFRPPACPGIFLELYHWFFLNLGMVLETCMKYAWWNWIFQKKIFCPENFLNLLKIFVINFYWICSMIKIYIICIGPGQIPYFGKFLFLRYGPKCSQPIRLQNFLISHTSRTNQ